MSEYIITMSLCGRKLHRHNINYSTTVMVISYGINVISFRNSLHCVFEKQTKKFKSAFKQCCLENILLKIYDIK